MFPAGDWMLRETAAGEGLDLRLGSQRHRRRCRGAAGQGQGQQQGGQQSMQKWGEKAAHGLLQTEVPVGEAGVAAQPGEGDHGSVVVAFLDDQPFKAAVGLEGEGEGFDRPAVAGATVRV